MDVGGWVWVGARVRACVRVRGGEGSRVRGELGQALATVWCVPGGVCYRAHRRAITRSCVVDVVATCLPGNLTTKKLSMPKHRISKLEASNLNS